MSHSVGDLSSWWAYRRSSSCQLTGTSDGATEGEQRTGDNLSPPTPHTGEDHVQDDRNLDNRAGQRNARTSGIMQGEREAGRLR